MPYLEQGDHLPKVRREARPQRGPHAALLPTVPLDPVTIAKIKRIGKQLN